MSLARQLGSISEQDYLDAEQQSEVRHEYVDGQVFAMAGASKRHNRIGFNVAKQLDEAALQQDCEVYSSDIKVRLGQRKTYYYPDVVVSCEDDTDNEYYLESPCLIVEVLSRSTWQKDYQEKLLAYQTIPALQTYLIVSQDEINVDCFHKDAQGNWWVDHLREMNATLELKCPQMSLSLADIYAGIQFPLTNKEIKNGQKTTGYSGLPGD